MNKFLVVLLGKSGSGKDTILKNLVNAGCTRLVTHTTRPIRPGEKEGIDYYFHKNEEYEKLKKAGKVLEEREYLTTMGIWYYWTGVFDLTAPVTVTVSTPTGLKALQKHLSSQDDAVIIPIYLEVPDEIRMERLLAREEAKAVPDYKEICRRFITDAKDFAEPNLQGILRIKNATLEDLDAIMQKIKEDVKCLS